MHIGHSQMEAKILRVKFHQKLTSIISVALEKEAWSQRKITSILTVLFWEKGPERRKSLKSAI